jgi:aspartyl-tRNA(Asn)/glutamyl-tRNA(Gln) amidotransferase subunit A
LGVGRGMTTAASPEPFALTLSAAQRMIRGGELSPVELARSCIDRIMPLDDRVHAFVDFRPEAALAEARAAEAEVGWGRHRALLGVPFAIKDQFDVVGAASFMTPVGVDRDAAVVSRLRAAGAVFLGKLAMTGYPDVPAPRNPWNLSRVTGGSSSGPAAAVAAQFCPVAIGEDSAGSARNPAAFCGLVGLVGTYGRVSRWGMASMGWTIDHPGVLTRTVEDAAVVFDVVAGHDPMDSSSSARPAADLRAACGADVSGMVVGVPVSVVESPALGVRADVLQRFRERLDDLAAAGARVVDVEIPLFAEATFIAFVIYIAEFSAAYQDQRGTILANPRDPRAGRLAMGALTTAADYLRAQRLRGELRRGLRRAFATVDVIATPTMSATAPAADADAGPINLWWASPGFTPVSNVAGLPALTVPAGFGRDDLPVGLHLMARPFDERAMVAIGSAVERAMPDRGNRPEV